MKASQILAVVGFSCASMAIPQYTFENEYIPDCPDTEYTKDVVEPRTRGPTALSGHLCKDPCELGRERSIATTVEVSVSGGISLDFVKGGGLNLEAGYAVSNSDAIAVSTVLDCKSQPGCICGVMHTDYVQHVKGTRTSYASLDGCASSTEPYEAEVPETQPGSEPGNNAEVLWEVCISSRSPTECTSTLARCPDGL